MKGFVLLLIMVGSCAASVMGPIETLQEIMSDDDADFDSEERVGPPDLMEVGRMIMTAMQSLLANQERTMDLRLKQLELYVDHTCSSGRPGTNNGQSQQLQITKEAVKNEVSEMLQGFVDYMSSMSHVLINKLEQQFDAKIDLAMKKIEDKLSENPLPPTTVHSDNDPEISASSISSPELNNEIMSAISRAVHNQVRNLAAQSDLLKQTEHFDKKFSKMNSLSNASTDNKILDYTIDIHNILYSFKPVYESFRKVVNNCDIKEDQFYQMERFEQLLQELKVEVDDNGNALADLFQTIEGAEDLLNEKLTTMENLTQHIYNESDKQQKQMVTSDPILPIEGDNNSRTLNECKNSDIVSRRSIDFCSVVVRHDKCFLRVFAFHCCRSCTDAGQLPELGPHRYINSNRNITISDIVK